MIEYKCVLPEPILNIAVKEGNETKFKTIDTLYFKEPSLSKLRCDFRHTREAFKRMSLALQDVLPKEAVEKKDKQENKQESKIETYEEVKARGFSYIEFIEYLKNPEFAEDLYNSFKIYLRKGSCYLTPQMEEENIVTATIVEELEEINLDTILALYIGFFLDYFILKYPQIKKKNGQ